MRRMSEPFHAEDRTTLSSVRNAIRLLREFSQEKPELSIKELSERLHLHKSTVFRILRTLCEERIVKQNEHNRRYTLDVGAFEIGSVFYHEIDICTVAFPLLSSLAGKVGEIVQLALYDQGDVVYLLKFPEDNSTVWFNGMGRRVPCHCTAIGKVLLAHQDVREIQRVLKGPLPAYTPATMTDPVLLEEELAKIRKLGCAESHEEYRAGMDALAVPVFDDVTGRVLAALSVTLPTSRFSPVRMQAFLEEMRKCSQLMTNQLEAIRWKRKKLVDSV
ncbi:MAG: IclR family transcriptional regulator [Alicyclobacillus sp.]|nr:IclR family transcriptional regulator [Alicyclobacillus sp.]